MRKLASRGIHPFSFTYVKLDHHVIRDALSSYGVFSPAKGTRGTPRSDKIYNLTSEFWVYTAGPPPFGHAHKGRHPDHIPKPPQLAFQWEGVSLV